MTSVSVVVPTYNRLDRLQRVLAGLERQTVEPDGFEVIVVSDGSADGTNDYLLGVKTPLHLQPLIQENQGVAAARNHGIDRATGEIILFIDDDVVPAPQLMAEHLRTHAAHGDSVIVLGPMLTPDDFDMAPWVRWEQAMLAKQYNDMIIGRWEPTARQFYTGNTSLARRHLLDVGGFDPAFRRAEDVEMAYRLAQRGLRFVFNPEAIGYHHAERSFQSWLEIPYAYGRNDVIFTRDKGQVWLLPMILGEFHSRHVMIRGLTWACLGRPRLTRSAIDVLQRLAGIGHRLGMPTVSRMAYSGIFNLRHYQGIADELDSRDAFFAEVARAEIKRG
jgi:GT2 family glycosyltransferase